MADTHKDHKKPSLGACKPFANGLNGYDSWPEACRKVTTLKGKRWAKQAVAQLMRQRGKKEVKKETLEWEMFAKGEGITA